MDEFQIKFRVIKLGGVFRSVFASWNWFPDKKYFLHQIIISFDCYFNVLSAHATRKKDFLNFFEVPAYEVPEMDGFDQL